MKYYLKTLSYLHIGSGNELETFDYVVMDSEKGKIFCRINDQIFSHFLEKNSLVKDYQNYSDKIYQELNKIKDNKEQNKKRKELRLDIFCDKIKKFGLLEDFIKENKKIQKIFIKDNDPNGNKVREQVRDALQNPYIPGSSIKGAFRTALFYHWLKNSADEKEETDISKTFKNDLDKVNIKKENFTKDIEYFAFSCKEENKDFNKEKFDEKLDLMKLLLVSDGKIVAKNPFDSLILAKPHLFLMSAEKQKQAIFMEAIQENTFIEFDIQFNVQFLFSIKHLIQKDDFVIIDGKKQWIGIKKQWIGIKTKCKQLFNLDIDSLTENNLQQKEQEVINFIIKKTQSFSEKQLKKHLQWKEKIPANPQKKKNQQEFFKKDAVNFQFVPANKPVMHLGFGTGFVGTTEFLYILEKESLKEKFLEVMKKFKIGSKEEYNPTLQDMENAFPKSRLMYETQENNKTIIKPLGWVEILTEKEFQDSFNQENLEQPKSYQPQYFKEKLKSGVTVHAQYLGKDPKNPKIKKFKLFIQEPGKEQECTLSYASDLEDNAFVIVTVRNVDKNGKVLNIEFKNLIK